MLFWFGFPGKKKVGPAEENLAEQVAPLARTKANGAAGVILSQPLEDKVREAAVGEVHDWGYPP